ncbi:MAG: hypothetical protein U0S12_12325 [Fimbriimonadales bacterium]
MSDLEGEIRQPTDERLWAILEGLRRGMSVDDINRICRVDKWFLRKLKHLVGIEQKLANLGSLDPSGDELRDAITEAADAGFSVATIKSLLGVTPELEQGMKAMRDEIGDRFDQGELQITATVAAFANENPEFEAELDDRMNEMSAVAGECPPTRSSGRRTTPWTPRSACASRLRASSATAFRKSSRWSTPARASSSQTPYYYAT